MFPRLLSCLALVVAGFAGGTARAYIDRALTLGRLVEEAKQIAVVEVARFHREKGGLLLAVKRGLKGQLGNDPLRHRVMGPGEAGIPRPVLEWAEPGRQGVAFVVPGTTLVCMGHGWYQVQGPVDEWWVPGPDRPDLPLAYQGTVSRLIKAVELMLSGQTAIITTVPHGAEDKGASFDLALNRIKLPGVVRLQRIRASLKMPPMVMATANPAYWVGLGPVGEEDIPDLIGKLRSPDAAVRMESADDLGTLGPAAASAAGALEPLLEDSSAGARMSAAAALIRIVPGRPGPLEVLRKGLESGEAAVRRHAARGAGLAGPASAPLARDLVRLLADADELTRMEALKGVATLGPSADGACAAVTALLDRPECAVEAADALGRIGPAARPALGRLARMLSSESAEFRWAAVRAMAQIGGDDAAPAVAFMIRELKNASEVDGYNMMIYLALLGPVAKGALPAIREARVRQPALRSATMWAIEPDQRLPWMGEGPRGGMQDADFIRCIYESFVQELGDRLRPAARALARKIMEGTAGDVPLWAYRLLSKFPQDSLEILAPPLAAPDLETRERAAVALGYMGAAAGAARAGVAEAMNRAPTERERRLLAWCLREIRGK